MIAPVLALLLILSGGALNALQGGGRGQAAPVPNAAVVAGTITAADGSPASAVRVAAIPGPPPNIRPEEGTQYYEAPPPLRTVFTDEQGRYRLTNLPPGRYYLAAGLVGQATYYPNAVDNYRATVITLEPNATATYDIRMVTPLGGRVQGKVTPVPPESLEQKAVLSGVTLAEIVETPVRPDGTFQFGRVPAGTYLVNLFPTPPGMGSTIVNVRANDADFADVRPPDTHTVSGRIVVENGPLPWSQLAFYTDSSYVAATIAADGTFRTQLHTAHHRAVFGGLPSGWDLQSVKIGTRDVTDGFDVTNADVTGVVITMSAPRELPHVRGRVDGVQIPAGATVEMTGPIFGMLTTAVKRDGSFEFPAVAPGVYRASIPALPSIAPVESVVVQWDGVAALRMAAR